MNQSKAPEYRNKYQKEYRHKLGISKNYYNPIKTPRTQDYLRLCLKITKAKRKSPGIFKLKTIQLIYENNIKQYGTLTCYLCLKPIEFRKDTLEHKVPMASGGTHEYENLAVACMPCNRRKNNRTEKEYRKIMEVAV